MVYPILDEMTSFLLPVVESSRSDHADDEARQVVVAQNMLEPEYGAHHRPIEPAQYTELVKAL